MARLLYFTAAITALSQPLYGSPVVSRSDNDALVANYDFANNLTVDYVTDPACQELAVQFPDLLSLPGTETFANESTSIWSEQCLLLPYCIFTPRSAQDIVAALDVFKQYGSQFQMRGGGHMPVPGAASTNQGIMVAMTNMRTFQPNVAESTITVGPGLRWQEVYGRSREYGLITLGGRYAPVGVPGLLLGGGISYFASRRGWAANQVKSIEIVTADGQIRNVSQTRDPDLFWALKGGSANYGIVTAFEQYAFPRVPIYGGSIATDDTEGLFEQLGVYVAAGENEGINDIDSAINVNFAIDPNAQTVSGTVVLFRNGSDVAPASLDGFASISSTSNTVSVRDFSDFVEESVPTADRSLRQSFYSTTFKASPEAISIINETVFRSALENLRGIEGVGVVPIFQPISRGWLEAARNAGGDAIDLDPEDAPLIVLDLSVHWDNPEDDTKIRAWTINTLKAIDDRTEEAGLYHSFIYLNDAGPGERPFATYGGGRSLAEMKEIRRRYDPDGVFQALSPGGFKLGL